MSESPTARRSPGQPPLSRALLGPVVVATALTLAAVLVSGTLLSGMLLSGMLAGNAGWVLAWLLLGLTAGYALSGSV